MKFITYIPKARNDGTQFDIDFLNGVIEQLWESFDGMTEEGEVRGRWTSPDGTVYRDHSIKISIACERERLQEAIQAVKKAGRRLRQEAMYFEVSGYDGVQILKIT
jgi:hypothetical protein